MFAFSNIQDWPVSLNSVMWLLIVYERPISIGIFIFFKRRIFIRNESVLLETILLPSYENFHQLSCAPSNFSYAINAISNIWHFYFFEKCQSHQKHLAFLFFFKCQNCPLFWHDIFILKCHAIIFWMTFININIWH